LFTSPLSVVAVVDTSFQVPTQRYLCIGHSLLVRKRMQGAQAEKANHFSCCPPEA
jgi:hypothetical protein